MVWTKLELFGICQVNLEQDNICLFTAMLLLQTRLKLLLLKQNGLGCLLNLVSDSC